MAAVTIRFATPNDAPKLSALAMRSKAHWGYDEAFMDACRDDLMVEPARCDGTQILVAEIDGMLAGFASVIGTPPVGELSDLWVDPSRMGGGVGQTLLIAARDHAKTRGFRALTIDSDPNAEAFYLHMGAVRIGQAPSTVDPDRLLPLLLLDL